MKHTIRTSARPPHDAEAEVDLDLHLRTRQENEAMSKANWNMHSVNSKHARMCKNISAQQFSAQHTFSTQTEPTSESVKHLAEICAATVLSALCLLVAHRAGPIAAFGPFRNGTPA